MGVGGAAVVWYSGAVKSAKYSSDNIHIPLTGRETLIGALLPLM